MESTGCYEGSPEHEELTPQFIVAVGDAKDESNLDGAPICLVKMFDGGREYRDTLDDIINRSSFQEVFKGEAPGLYDVRFGRHKNCEVCEDEGGLFITYKSHYKLEKAKR